MKSYEQTELAGIRTSAARVADLAGYIDVYHRPAEGVAKPSAAADSVLQSARHVDQYIEIGRDGCRNVAGDRHASQVHPGTRVEA